MFLFGQNVVVFVQNGSIWALFLLGEICSIWFIWFHLGKMWLYLTNGVCILGKWFFLDKLVLFEQKLFYLGKRWLYLGKGAIILSKWFYLEKLNLFEQIGSFWQNWFYLGKRLLYLVKILVFGQIGSISANWFFLGKLVLLGQNWNYLGKR